MTIVVLAAGAAHRMGRQKLLLPVEGRALVERVLDAASAWPIVIVVSDAIAPMLGATPLCIIRNDAPERGMSHSLALANCAIPIDEPIAIVLGDLPDITPSAIAAVIAQYDDTVDVVVPRCGDVFVHPVVFGPRARAKIAALPDGDTIQRVRDDPSMRRRIVEAGGASLTDIDTPGDYFERTGQHINSVKSLP